MIDGMIVREMGWRCNYDADQILKVMGLISGNHPTRANELSPNHELVKTLWGWYSETGYLSARILGLLDEHNIHLVDPEVISGLVKTLPEYPFPVLSNHDCFRCHPNYGNDLRRQYNQILHDLAKSMVLSSIVSQIVGEPMRVDKLGDFSDKILSANYALS